MFSLPILITIYAGFTHAFEADHLLAVSSIVSGRSNNQLAMKDGIYWGLGHTSTTIFIGILMIIFKIGIPVVYFNYFEAMVGVMLSGLAIHRIVKFYLSRKSELQIHLHPHNHIPHQHVNLPLENGKGKHPHSLAYQVGLMHGLAGSGALVILALSKMNGPVDGLTYLIIFGLGCIGGMMLASTLFNIPFSKKMMESRSLQNFLIIMSSMLCLLYGGKLIYENLFM
ncbi:MAG: urease accessory protein [Saprospiraceae bacterium]